MLKEAAGKQVDLGAEGEQHSGGSPKERLLDGQVRLLEGRVAALQEALGLQQREFERLKRQRAAPEVRLLPQHGLRERKANAITKRERGVNL